jgi:hypothetical protein
MLYLFRLWQGVFLGSSTEEISLVGSKNLLGIVVIFAIISLILGIFVSYPMSMITSALSSLGRIG